MKYIPAITATCSIAALAAAWNVQPASSQAGWTTLFDGKNLDNWTQVGSANWSIVDGAVQANKGNGFLVSKQDYRNYQLRAEFYVESDSNSGIFIRCTNPEKITATECYEVNIWDSRPDPSYGTGAIVNVAKVDPMPKAGGKWNVYEITANGPTLTVVLNGQTTVNGVKDEKLPNGRIALQYGEIKDKTPVVKFRKVEIKPL
jgi:hypothetical protein